MILCIYECSKNELGLIIALYFATLLCTIFSSLKSFSYKKQKLYIYSNVIFFFVLLIILPSLLEINYAYFNIKGTELSLISTIISQFFVWPLFILCVVIILFSIYSISYFYIKETKNFSFFTVKKAIENLPTGLLFYDSNGSIALSNRIMHTLSLELCSKDLQNGIEFKTDLKNLGEYPVFCLEDGSVWQFSQSTVSIEKQLFTELRADNISELYYLGKSISEANEKLKKEQIRLVEHTKKINEYISEEESLRVKMLIHDDFGELIAVTVRNYEKGLKREKKQELLLSWKKLINKFDSLFDSDDVEKFSLAKIYYFAKQLHCELIIEGRLPDNEQKKELIFTALYESLKNAVYHAKVDILKVSVTEECESFIISIQNKNTNNLLNVQEGGGLSALRDKIEKEDGIMTFTCNEYITLKIVLNTTKKEKSNV